MKPQLKTYLQHQATALGVALSEAEAVAQRLAGVIATLGDDELVHIHREVEAAVACLDESINELKKATGAK
jgi:prefoldin subunit 5